MTKNKIKEKHIIFYGAGVFAKKNIDCFISMGIVPVCFADRDIRKHYQKMKSSHGDFEILPLDEAISRYPNFEIIVTVSRPAFSPVLEELLKTGIDSRRISPAPFYGDIRASVSLIQNIIKTGSARKVEIFGEHTEFTVGLFNNESIKLHGSNSTYAILAQRGYEEQELRICRQILAQLPENAVFFDIGANIGYYSLCLKKLFPKMNVHAFEPSKSTFSALSENISLNNLTGVFANNFGFYNEEKVMELYAYEEAGGHTSLRNILGSPDYKKEKCDFTTLDSYVEENNITQLDFIKCDVEGAELFVFRGGHRTLEKFKPVVLSEINSYFKTITGDLYLWVSFALLWRWLTVKNKRFMLSKKLKS